MEDGTELRRFAIEATKEYWDGFHTWYKIVKPENRTVIQMPDRAPSVTNFRRFEGSGYGEIITCRV